jgi:drug/metabolite transporter (DMT)-like permease
MKIKDNIIRIYGNSGFLFDLIISLTIFLLILYFNSEFKFISYDKQFITSLLSFFGILAGFMLTAFSLLLLYNPKEEESPKFKALRKSPAFKTTLKYFILTILIILISVTLLFILLIKTQYFIELISIFFAILSFFMIARCLYYLFAIIDFE